jgi:ubiquinone/menaquinone biosynthesis C-methylase UbiE
LSIFDGIANTYDLFLWPLEMTAFRRLRARLVELAYGQVLEIGVGTGANFSYYAPHRQMLNSWNELYKPKPQSLAGTVHEGDMHVFALDASASMLRAARRRPCWVCASATQADSQTLPFADASFDTVLATFVFCSLPDPLQSLSEIKRVIKPGGQLLLMDHTRGTQPVTRWLTDALHPAWYRLNGSCSLNRETARTVAQAGFEANVIEHRFGGVIQLVQARNH